MGVRDRYLCGGVLHRHRGGTRGYHTVKLPRQYSERGVCIIFFSILRGCVVRSTAPRRHAHVPGHRHAEFVSVLHQSIVHPKYSIPLPFRVLLRLRVVPGRLAEHIYQYVLSGFGVLEILPSIARLLRHLPEQYMLCRLNLRFLKLQYTIRRIRVRM